MLQNSTRNSHSYTSAIELAFSKGIADGYSFEEKS